MISNPDNTGLQVSDRPELYEKTLLIAVSQFWGQPFQNAQRFEKGPQNKMNNYPMNSVSCESQVVVILRRPTTACRSGEPPTVQSHLMQRFGNKLADR